MAYSVDSQFARFGSTRYATDKITSFRIEQEHRRAQGNNDRSTLLLLGGMGVLAGVGFLIASVAGTPGGEPVLGLVLVADAGLLLWKGWHVSPDKRGTQRYFGW